MELELMEAPAEVSDKRMPGSYKMTELGVIPEDWIDARFEDVMIGFSSGQTPSRKHPEYFRGNILWITSGELNYNIIRDTYEKITAEAALKTNLKFLPKNTFLIAITGLEAEGTRGSCGIVGVEATTNQSCMALFPIEALLTTTYLYHFYANFGKLLALKYCQGTKQQSYTGKTARTLPIILPPTLEEQAAIADALSDADELIGAVEKLIEKKRHIKQGTMQALLTGRRRLPGFEGEWENYLLRDIFTFLSTSNHSRKDLSDNGEIGYIHYGDIHSHDKSFWDLKKRGVPFLSNTPSNPSSFLEDGDLIIADASEDYIGIGKSVEVTNVSNRRIVAGLHTLLLRADKKIVSKGFRGYITSISAVKEQLIRIATGISVYGISKNKVKDVMISLPSLAEQTAIAVVLSDMDAEIEQLERKLAKLQMVKQGMMQALLTGKTRLI